MYKSKISMILVIILCMNLIATPIPAFAVEEGGSPVHVWLTDISTDSWIASQNDVSFQTVQTANPITIKVNASQKYQEIQGFGAAMTDSSAWLIDKLSASGKATLMNNLFNTTTGIGISLLRTPMGATDVNASGSYSYDDMPAGETDQALSNFSVEHDEAYIIPALQQALAFNPSIKITATPWSAPGWMKTSGSMIGGTLKDEYYDTFANYFVKFIQAYSNAGVPISYVSPQNEPMGTPTWPGMFLSPYQESTLIQEMGQAFQDNGISTKILVWDHNWDVPTYPEKIYSNIAASNYAYGTAWHIYSGNANYQTIVHNDYPGKQSFITEATGGTWQADDQEAFQDALNTWIIEGTRNWANGVMLWNIALDPEMGPLNSDTNGIPMMRGLVTIDPDTDEVTYNPDYYALAHASKFVQPGAYRIYSNTFGEGSIEDVAFQNPDGSKVLIVYNSSSDSQTFSVADGTEAFDYTLKAGNAATFTWTGPVQNGSIPAAVNVSDPTHDFVFQANTDSAETVTGSTIITTGSALTTTGSAIITYDPALLEYHKTVCSGDDVLTYSLPTGASIQNTEGTALDRSGWSVTASSNSTGDSADENGAGDSAMNAIDGDLGTRWTNGHGQKNGDWYQIDLGTSTSFDQIVLENGTDSSFDYTNKYQVYVSNDGVNWGSALANGSGGIGKIIITLPTTQTARYIRIVNTAASGFWWSISEINVYASSRTDYLAAPASVSNGLQLQSWTSQEGAQVTVVYNGTGSSQDFTISTEGTVTYTLPCGSSAMFTTKASSGLTPTFGSLTPDVGIAGNKVTITGSNFGDLQGMGTVYFGSVPAYINSWSDSSITVYVPDGLSSGAVNVTVNGSNGEYAGGSSFQVKSLPAALDRTGWVASASNVSPWGDVPAKMLDGDSNSRYSSGTGQYNGLMFTVDMGQTETFNRIMIDSGSGSNDYARSSDVYVSADGINWSKVTSVIGTDPLQLIAFPTQKARYIKIMCTGSEGYWWSVAEFKVYNTRSNWTTTASDVSSWGDVPQNMLDGNTDTRYSSGTGQYDGLYFSVDMGQSETFNKVVINSGAGSNDYTRSSDVYVSNDGIDWIKVSSITGTGPQQEATFKTQTARYIKIVCTGNEGYWWSVAEFDAYEVDTEYRTDWTATATDVSPWGDVPSKMLDGNSGTRYSSGTGQYDGLSFTVDMGQTKSFNRLVIDSGSGSNDYARSSDVYVSTDKTDWIKVSSVAGSGSLQEISFKTQTARYIKVVCTDCMDSWWSVAEFNVYNTRSNWTVTATDVSPWGDVPSKMLDSNRSTRYSSGTGQYNGLSFTVDMGQAETFDKLVIDSGDGSNDYARSSDVLVSTNGTDWTKVSSIIGTGSLQQVSFQAQTARYIKIVCTGNEGYWWSVAEFEAYSTASEYRRGWSATATDVSPWGDVPANMLDGDTNTRYSSGTGQYNGLSFTVDMGQTETFDKIVINSGSGSNDYARNSDVYVSTDGTAWTKISSVIGTGSLQEVTFQAQTARYVKVVCTGNEGYWWSVAEFNVYNSRTFWSAAASDVSPWGDVPGKMLDGDISTKYSSGTSQYEGLNFTVDMGQAKAFNKIMIDSGSGSNDYARSADVYVSADGSTWIKISSITGTGPLQTIGFQTQTARYIKVVCTGNEGYWWSVAEFHVYYNNAPVQAAIGSKSAEEGSLLSFKVNASDVNYDTLIYSANILPQGATFNATTGEFSWTPDNTQAGTYTVTFTVSDGILTDSEEVTIIINNVDTESGITPTAAPTAAPTEMPTAAPTTIPITPTTIPATPTVTPTPTTVPSPIPTATPIPVPDKVGIVVEPEVKGDTATAKVDLKVLENAFEQAVEDEDGIKTIQLEVEAADGVTEYVQEIPKDIFNTSKNQETQKTIEIATPVGTIVVPDNMFKGSDIKKAENVGISVATADVTSLSSETRAKIGDRPVIELNATVDGEIISWKNNDAPVTISIHYTPTATELKNPDAIVIWYIDGKGKVQSVPTGKYDPVTGKVTFKTTHFSTYAVAYNLKTFKDAGKYKWAKTPIEMVASKGIMNGTSGTLFNPDANITKAQFVDALVKTLGLTAEFDTNYKDIKKTSGYYESAGIAKKLGLVVGTGNNQFHSNAVITRQEIAVLIVRAMKLSGKTTADGNVKDLKKYSDYSKISSKSVGAMAILAKEGTLTGKGNKLNPTGKVTRAQTALIMYRIMNKK